MSLSQWRKSLHEFVKWAAGQEYYEYLYFRYHIHIKSRFESLDPSFWEKPIFIHIPKTAGTSVRQLDVSCYKWHKPITFLLKKKPKDQILPPTFTIVRHPYHRLSSAYFYLKDGGNNSFDKIWAKNNLASYPSINDFVQQGLPKRSVRQWVHFRPQSHFVTGKNGEILVDHILKLEELNSKWEEVSQKLGLSSNLPKKNVSRGGAKYQKLSEKSRSLIREFYAEDFKRFDYKP